MKKTLQNLILFTLLLSYLNSKAQYYWEEVIVPDTVDVKMIAFNSSGNQFIASNHGVYYSEDDHNWYQSGLPNYVSYIYINENNTIYSGMNKLFRSFDNGLTWDSVFYYSQGGIMSLCTSGDSIILLGTWGGIFRSDDYGQTWSNVLDTYNSEVINEIVYNSEGTLYAGSISYFLESPGGVYRSDDNGITWNLYCLDYHYVSSLIINSEDELFVGTRGHAYYGGGRVLKSIDDGLTWTIKYDNNLIESMAINIFGDIALGCDSQEGEPGGILISYDSGESWEDITNNLPTQAFDQVTFSPDNYLYTVTHFEDRLFKTDTPVGISESPKLNGLNHFRIFPNPASSYINIYLNDTKKNGIAISDITGNLVYNLTINHNCNLISVNIENLKSGLYFIHLSDESKSGFTYRFIKY
jgi:photosystem II stability/assembly factor-like uncharacterized protein